MAEVYTEETLFKSLNQKELRKLADKFKEYKENKANMLGVNAEIHILEKMKP